MLDLVAIALALAGRGLRVNSVGLLVRAEAVLDVLRPASQARVVIAGSCGVVHRATGVVVAPRTVSMVVRPVYTAPRVSKWNLPWRSEVEEGFAKSIDSLQPKKDSTANMATSSKRKGCSK